MRRRVLVSLALLAPGATLAAASAQRQAYRACTAGDQPCYDAVRFRPTFQQAVEVQGYPPR